MEPHTNTSVFPCTGRGFQKQAQVGRGTEVKKAGPDCILKQQGHWDRQLWLVRWDGTSPRVIPPSDATVLERY
jgi:hypothetical protein